MKKITFEVPGKKKLDINGHVFEVLQNDTDIIDNSLKLRARYANLTGKKGIAEIDTAAGLVDEVVDYIDKVLGAGATKKIFGANPISLSAAVKLLFLIYNNIADDYAKDIKESYGV